MVFRSQVNDESLTLRDSIASLLGAVDDVRNIPRTLALEAGEQFKEETGLTLPQSWLVRDSQASNMRGRFVSGFDASRRRLTGTAGQRRFDAFAGGYDALGNPTGGVGPASNLGDRKSVVAGKSVAVSVDLGGRGNIKKKK